MKKLVYICSPCRGDYEKNIDNAATYSRAAFRKVYIPITPHLYFTRFMDDTNDKERSMAMEAGSQLLLMCSEVWVFGLDHPSEGMQAEIALAIRHGIPIIDGDEILSGKKKPEHHDEIDARLYAAASLQIAKTLKIPPHILQEMQDDPTTAAGAERYARRRDSEAAAACEAVQKKALDDYDRWLKRQLKNPERQHQRIQILVVKRRRREE